MLRILRLHGSGVVYVLSGRMEPEDVPELRTLLNLESAHPISLDFQEVTLVGRGAVAFLSECEINGVHLVNCPTYVRQWIEAERLGRH